MVDEDFSTNIDWKKKKKISDSTRESRKIDVQKEILSDKKDRNKFTDPVVKKLSPNLRKIRKKIKDVYDEEYDEEDEVVFFFSPEVHGPSSLMNALKDEEKLQLQVKNTIEIQSMQETAGKMEAVLAATKVSEHLGVKPLEKKELNKKVLDTTLSSEAFDETLRKNIAEKTNIDAKKINLKRGTTLLNGLKNISSKADVAGKTDKQENSALPSLHPFREKDDSCEQIAKIILKKTGRVDDKAKKKIKNKNTNKSKQLQNDIKKAKSR